MTTTNTEQSDAIVFRLIVLACSWLAAAVCIVGPRVAWNYAVQCGIIMCGIPTVLASEAVTVLIELYLWASGQSDLAFWAAVKPAVTLLSLFSAVCCAAAAAVLFVRAWIRACTARSLPAGLQSSRGREGADQPKKRQ
jgi:hypothetical protein